MKENTNQDKVKPAYTRVVGCAIYIIISTNLQENEARTSKDMYNCIDINTYLHSFYSSLL